MGTLFDSDTEPAQDDLMQTILSNPELEQYRSMTHGPAPQPIIGLPQIGSPSMFDQAPDLPLADRMRASGMPDYVSNFFIPKSILPDAAARVMSSVLPERFTPESLQEAADATPLPIGALKWGSDVLKPMRASSPRTWTPERVQALREHIAAGGTLTGERGFEGGNLRNMTRAATKYGIESPGVYKGGRNPIHGQDVVDKITELVKQGQMPSQIAPQLGLTREQVKSIYTARVKPNLEKPPQWQTGGRQMEGQGLGGARLVQGGGIKQPYTPPVSNAPLTSDAQDFMRILDRYMETGDLNQAIQMKRPPVANTPQPLDPNDIADFMNKSGYK